MQGGFLLARRTFLFGKTVRNSLNSVNSEEFSKFGKTVRRLAKQ